ncbi:MAG: methyltransferase domain-containing protein [Leptolyngbya sp.]|nr:methyltransferase domain-containing protein [Candidatus Melainabacteria bacterium]
MPDAHYINSKLAEIYDFDSGWSVDRDFYFGLAGSERQRILDLGCGTGLLCNAYAGKNHDVTGVDPSRAMLEVGRQKEHGKDIDWIESNAQSFETDKTFDLIIMTGHAFQVLLEDADVHATFATMREHLKPGGLIVFESRNPAIDWAKQWDYAITLELPGATVSESRRLISFKDDRMVFELSYKFPDENLQSMSELRFMSRREITEHLAAAGLLVKDVLGNWDGAVFDETMSEEMIFMVTRPED